MKQPNIAQTVANVWSEVIAKQAGPDWPFDEPIKKARKPSKAELAKWKREDAAYRRAERRAKAKFKGEIVGVDGSLYDMTLVYADGRRLRVYECRWAEAGE